MEMMTQGETFQRSFVSCLPFINAPASDYDTIYTALRVAVDKCKVLKQDTCIVTFDQPLFMKAQDIIAHSGDDSELKNVVVRLGGFHLLMSFLGAIGYIMNGSGLKELLCTVYAPNSVEKMMTGHAYSRALRAHFLTYQALTEIILHSMEFSDEAKSELEEILILFNEKILTSGNNPTLHEFLEDFKKKLVELEQRGPTAKLWVQYTKMIMLVRQFIVAERSGDWQLHLSIIRKMQPFFYASGHFLYFKSCQLYLQQMYTLKNKMNPREYECFTSQGMFTIRRSNKFWCGTWSDMVIEQTLMKSMKSQGGVTRGRGVSENVLSTWILGTVYLQNVCNTVEEFCNVSYETSEQHKDFRGSRIDRDKKDVQKILTWLDQHPPFPKVPEIKSLSTGIVGNSSINCHLAQEIGLKGFKQIVDLELDFQSMKFQRKFRCNPLGTMRNGIKIDDDVVPIDPQILYRRMCIAKRSEEELEEFLKFELSPYPLSLFTEEGFYKGTKSHFYNEFSPIDGSNYEFQGSHHVIDGGFLLHRAIWPKNETFLGICGNYVRFVQKNYSNKSTIVFDGYPENIGACSTKVAERARRERKKSSVEFIFDEDMTPTVSQASFLSNSKNKERLIQMLKSKFENSGMNVRQATEDADLLIVQTAIEKAPDYPFVIIVGEDVDLLILMTALCKSNNVFLMKPGKGKRPQMMYSLDSLNDKSITESILFLHAFSGCDTTSAIFGHGKSKFVQTFQTYPNLQASTRIFYDLNAAPTAIADAGNNFLIRVYGCRDENVTLNSFRHQFFVRTAYRSSHNIAALPPTEDAARQHSFRTYLQIQRWLGNHKKPEEWGWKKTKTVLTPVMTTQPPAPDKLLKFITCKCKTGCHGRCGCRKAGLKCSAMCVECCNACDNAPESSLIDVDSDDEDAPLQVEMEQSVEETEQLSDFENEPDQEDARAPMESSFMDCSYISETSDDWPKPGTSQTRSAAAPPTSTPIKRKRYAR
nr:PREDICTED: uncharacterized protein LOC109040498 [Bemisia tabaci]